MNNAAANLSFDEHRIDHLSAVMGDHVTQDVHPSRSGIDFYFSNVIPLAKVV